LLCGILQSLNWFLGHIRRWIYYEESQMIIYDIGDNRWCGNIQREHKSNHIYYVADLKFSYIYQKCHDFECTHYRSPETPIPPETNPILGKIKGLNESLDDELYRLFEEDIDFIGKINKENEPRQECSQENFFEDEDEVLDDEILKLSSPAYIGKLPDERHEFTYFSESSNELFLEEPLFLNQSSINNNNSNNDNNTSCSLYDDNVEILDGSADLFEETSISHNDTKVYEEKVEQEKCCISNTTNDVSKNTQFSTISGEKFYHDEQFDTTKIKSTLDYSTNETEEEDSVLNAIFNEDISLLSDFI